MSKLFTSQMSFEACNPREQICIKSNQSKVCFQLLVWLYFLMTQKFKFNLLLQFKIVKTFGSLSASPCLFHPPCTLIDICDNSLAGLIVPIPASNFCYSRNCFPLHTMSYVSRLHTKLHQNHKSASFSGFLFSYINFNFHFYLHSKVK